MWSQRSSWTLTIFSCMCLTCIAVVAGADCKASNMSRLLQNEFYKIYISVLQVGRILHVQMSFGLGDWKPRKYVKVFTRPDALSFCLIPPVTRQLFCYSYPLLFAYRARWRTDLGSTDTRSNPG